MKIVVYNYMPKKESFDWLKKKYPAELVLLEEQPDMSNAWMAEGADALSIVTRPMPGELIEEFKRLGIKFISTRTIGFDHIDLDAAKKAGMGIGNVNYSPYSVAEFAMMLILMTLRKAKLILDRYAVQDFTTDKVQGRELHNQTVGIIGTGRIGAALIRLLSGSGCRILANSEFESEEVKKYATYVTLDELIEQSDVISIHIPATKENEHLINAERISRMKDGVILINTARSPLIDTAALIEGLESGKIGAAGLDVVDGEDTVYFAERKGVPIANRELAILRSFPNVIMTPHFAFYTDQAVADMAENSIRSCILELEGKENPWRLV